MVEHKRTRYPLTEFMEPVGLQLEFSLPLEKINAREPCESLRGDGAPVPLNVIVFRRPAQWSLCRADATANSVDDPFENSHVVTESGPHELAALIATKPIHTIDNRLWIQMPARLQPVSKVVSHVVAAKRQHRKRVASHHSLLPLRRCCRLGAQCRSEVDAPVPMT